jgi:hypothetical protein
MGEKMQQKLESFRAAFSLSRWPETKEKTFAAASAALTSSVLQQIDENLVLFSGIWQAPKLLRDSKRNA